METIKSFTPCDKYVLVTQDVNDMVFVDDIIGFAVVHSDECEPAEDSIRPVIHADFLETVEIYERILHREHDEELINIFRTKMKSQK